MQWASGNPGYDLSGMALNETQYPTVQHPTGYSGKCVKLTTLSTGNFESLSECLLLPEIYLSDHSDTQNAVLALLQATHFGFPLTKRPSKITGWSKYKAGDVFYR